MQIARRSSSPSLHGGPSFQKALYGRMGSSVGAGVAGGAVGAEGVAGAGAGVGVATDPVAILKDTEASPICTLSMSNNSTSTQQSLGDANAGCWMSRVCVVSILLLDGFPSHHSTVIRTCPESASPLTRTSIWTFSPGANGPLDSSPTRRSWSNGGSVGLTFGVSTGFAHGFHVVGQPVESATTPSTPRTFAKRRMSIGFSS